MSSNAGRTIIVLGIGNPLRSDDGVGPWVVQELEARGISGVRWLTAHQLDLDLLEEVPAGSLVVLVDASSDGEDLRLSKIEASARDQLSSSHHLTPGLFISLAREVYGKSFDLYLCSLRGREFGFGQEFSPEVKISAQLAVEQLSLFLGQGVVHA